MCEMGFAVAKGGIGARLGIGIIRIGRARADTKESRLETEAAVVFGEEVAGQIPPFDFVGGVAGMARGNSKTVPGWGTRKPSSVKSGISSAGRSAGSVARMSRAAVRRAGRPLSFLFGAAGRPRSIAENLIPHGWGESVLAQAAGGFSQKADGKGPSRPDDGRPRSQARPIQPMRMAVKRRVERRRPLTMATRFPTVVPASRGGEAEEKDSEKDAGGGMPATPRASQRKLGVSRTLHAMSSRRLPKDRHTDARHPRR